MVSATRNTLITLLLFVLVQTSGYCSPTLIENDKLAFSVAGNGSWQLLDKRTSQTWQSNPDAPRFAVVSVRRGTNTTSLPAAHFADVRAHSGCLVLDWHPSWSRDAGILRFTAKLLPEDRGVKVSWRQIGGEWRVTGVQFPDRSFRCTKSEAGYLVVSNRLGIIVPAGENSPGKRRYPTYGSYGGCSMAMAGAVKNGSAVLMSWEDPNCVLETDRGSDLSYVQMSLVSNGPEGCVTLRPVGPGGYVEIARTYRDVARERGFLVTWKDKLPSGNIPTAGAAFLSSDNLMILNGKRTVIWSFEECARNAEHYKKNLGIHRAMYCLRGFNNGGYDCRYPDLLPAAPECGGNEGLIDCGRRLAALGYLFGLHDNYQDIYKDSPSWDAGLVMRNRDSSLQLGFTQGGGQSYRVNSKKGLRLAQRPQNIPGVKDLYKPTFYYLDTTCASPLFEDFSRENPLTLRGDMYWKQRLLKYAREQIAVVGTEEGYEWAVPYCDYFWSLLTRTDAIIPSFTEIPVPLFEMVYGDCVDLHQGNWSMIMTPQYILDHILCAEIPYCVYTKYDPAKPWCKLSEASRCGSKSVQLTLEWKTYEAGPARNYGLAIHFAEPKPVLSRRYVFSEGLAFSLPTSQWPISGSHADGPVRISHEELSVPVDGDKCYDVYVCMTSNADGTGTGIGIRGIDVSMSTGWPGGVESYIGRLTLGSDGSVSVSAPALPMSCHFARCDNRQDCSYQNDGLLLNTYRICSPLNRITADTPMTGHEFLTEDRLVQKSEFLDVVVTVNYSSDSRDVGNAVLAPYGFLVESPRLVAFCASSYHGRTFTEPTLAILTSTDGKPLATSGAVDCCRVYGDRRVTVAGKDFRLD